MEKIEYEKDIDVWDANNINVTIINNNPYVTSGSKEQEVSFSPQHHKLEKNQVCGSKIML